MTIVIDTSIYSKKKGVYLMNENITYVIVFGLTVANVFVIVAFSL